MESKSLAAVFAAASLVAATAQAQNAFIQHNLVSDLPGLADNLDTNLVNPWGISFSGTSAFWIADNGAGLSTLYTGTGTPVSLVVTIPPPLQGYPPAAPTGTVFNSTTNFRAAGSATKFLFDTEDGTISAWSSGSAAELEVDNSDSGAVYKGLAAGAFNGTNYLYATDFHDGVVTVVDGNWNQQNWPGAFVDATLPAGFAPFNIRNIGGKLYVTYALQDAEKHDDQPGPGNGFVDVYDTGGTLLQRLISQGALNSPWGLALAPQGFGSFGGDLLVGNFGDGQINVFDPTNGSWIDVLNDTTGHPLAEPGLWAITFGNGAGAGATNVLYFTAGIAGPGALEDHGLLASVTPAFANVLGAASYHQHNLVSDLPGVADFMDTNLVNPWGISFSASSPFWIADNGSGLSTLYNGAGAITPLVVTIPTPTGGTPPAAPTGTVFNSTTNFKIGGTTNSKFLFDTEDGTISAWASGAGAVLEVDDSASGDVFKGLAAGVWNGSNYIYATDFHNGKILAYDGNWNLANTFTDGSLPKGFAPFGIQNIGGKLCVTFALQDGEAHDDVPGPGNGYVDVFDTGGNLLQQLIAGGALDSPWGLAVAPPGFGAYSGALLVGNFGDGHINAYNAANGAWMGPVYNETGDPFQVLGLWGLAFGNGAGGASKGSLYFTAGIPGPGNVEDHGLFGVLTPTFVSFGAATTSSNATIILSWDGGLGPFMIQQKSDLSNSTWSNVTATTNFTLTVTNTGTNNFFRIFDTGRATP